MSVTSKDIELAEKGRRLLRTRSKSRARLGVGSSETVDLPAPARDMLEKALGYLAEGRSVIVLSEAAELTTQQAADILKVSRPFVVKLLENGEIPFRKVGKHRRILAADVVSYKEFIDKERLKALEELTREAQKLGSGY